MNQLVELLATTCSNGVCVKKIEGKDGLKLTYKINLEEDATLNVKPTIYIHQDVDGGTADIRLLDGKKKPNETVIFFETKLYRPTNEELFALEKELEAVYEYALYYEGGIEEKYQALADELEKFYYKNPQD